LPPLQGEIVVIIWEAGSYTPRRVFYTGDPAETGIRVQHALDALDHASFVRETAN
jgi:hypothetical protein